MKKLLHSFLGWLKALFAPRVAAPPLEADPSRPRLYGTDGKPKPLGSLFGGEVASPEPAMREFVEKMRGESMKQQLDAMRTAGRRAIELRDELEVAVLELMVAQHRLASGVAMRPDVDLTQSRVEEVLAVLHEVRGDHPQRQRFVDLRLAAGLVDKPPSN